LRRRSRTGERDGICNAHANRRDIHNPPISLSQSIGYRQMAELRSPLCWASDETSISRAGGSDQFLGKSERSLAQAMCPAARKDRRIVRPRPPANLGAARIVMALAAVDPIRRE